MDPLTIVDDLKGFTATPREVADGAAETQPVLAAALAFSHGDTAAGFLRSADAMGRLGFPVRSTAYLTAAQNNAVVAWGYARAAEAVEVIQ